MTNPYAIQTPTKEEIERARKVLRLATEIAWAGGRYHSTDEDVRKADAQIPQIPK